MMTATAPHRFLDTGRRLLLLFALIPAVACALSTDRDQPLTVEADSAAFDDKSGVSTYRGAVSVQQGSLRLHADVITVTRQAQGSLLVAEGKPVKFRQRPDGESRDVEATARRLEYRTGSDRLQLDGDAVVRQSGNIFRSQHIVYDMATNRVQAGAGTGRTPEGGPKERVHITIQPRQAADQAAQPPAP